MRNYTVLPEFKTRLTEILSTKKFSTVFPFMNLINREGFTYNEAELNQMIQFVGEFAYNEVAEFFQLIPSLVQEEGTSQPQESEQQEASLEEVPF